MQYIFKVEWQQQFKSSGICTNHKFFVHFRDIATTCKKMSSGQTLGVKAQRFRGHTSPHRNVKEKKICHQKYYFTQNLRVLWKFNNSHVLTFEMLLQNATKYNLRELSLQYQYIYQNFNTLYTQMFTLNIITTGIVQPTMYCCQHLANEISRKCATQFWQILCKCQNSQLLQDFTKQNHATIIKITFNYSVLYSTMLINNKTCIHTYPFYLQQNSEIFNQVIRNNKVQVSTNLLYAHHSCSHQLATMYVLLQKISQQFWEHTNHFCFSLFSVFLLVTPIRADVFPNALSSLRHFMLLYSRNSQGSAACRTVYLQCYQTYTQFTTLTANCSNMFAKQLGSNCVLRANSMQNSDNKSKLASKRLIID
eukprot:TRINITY_DN1957_c0_g2_i9.p1 TRINITY_DN1957_c0_g2~~TRINITY_DN1957_c0_g2_i9.p1  ORF type:complete len:365 (-),score=-1.65 TRINITY_DN1957_c0_g2_i9:28-1122(-)